MSRESWGFESFSPEDLAEEVKKQQERIAEEERKHKEQMGRLQEEMGINPEEEDAEVRKIMEEMQRERQHRDEAKRQAAGARSERSDTAGEKTTGNTYQQKEQEAEHSPGANQEKHEEPSWNARSSYEQPSRRPLHMETVGAFEYTQEMSLEDMNTIREWIEEERNYLSHWREELAVEHDRQLRNPISREQREKIKNSFDTSKRSIDEMQREKYQEFHELLERIKSTYFEGKRQREEAERKRSTDNSREQARGGPGKAETKGSDEQSEPEQPQTQKNERENISSDEQVRQELQLSSEDFNKLFRLRNESDAEFQRLTVLVFSGLENLHDIPKKYIEYSKQWHEDLFPDERDKAGARVKFQIINNINAEYKRRFSHSAK